MKDSIKIFLNRAPFIKLLIPLIAGILIQSIFSFSLNISIIVAGSAALCFFSFAFLPQYEKLRLSGLKTFSINLMIVALGMLLFTVKDVRTNYNWFGHFYKPNDILNVILNEKPVEKDNSYKAEAIVKDIIKSHSSTNTSGRVIIYFKKDSSLNRLAREPGLL